jgi:vanillate O-demethylase monooxygenase subunit
VKYSIVWVRLDNSFDCTEIPYFSDWDKPGMQTIVADSYLWNTVAERRWENFTDFSHFAFVHPGTLYDPFFASHPAVQVNRIDGELQFKLAPPREMEGIPEEAPMGTSTTDARCRTGSTSRSSSGRTTHGSCCGQQRPQWTTRPAATS